MRGGDRGGSVICRRMALSGEWFTSCENSSHGCLNRLTCSRRFVLIRTVFPSDSSSPLKELADPQIRPVSTPSAPSTSQPNPILILHLQHLNEPNANDSHPPLLICPHKLGSSLTQSTSHDAFQSPNRRFQSTRPRRIKFRSCTGHTQSIGFTSQEQWLS